MRWQLEDSHVVESNENERQWMHQLPSVRDSDEGFSSVYVSEEDCETERIIPSDQEESFSSAASPRKYAIIHRSLLVDHTSVSDDDDEQFSN